MRPHHRVGDPAVAGVTVFGTVGRADAVQEGRQCGRLEGRPFAFGEFVDQCAEPGAAEGAVGVVDRGEYQGLAGSHVGGGHGAQSPAGEVVVVQGEAAAVTEPHALGKGERFLLGEKVGDGVDGHETEVDRNLVGVMTHGRVGGELAGQGSVGVSDSWRPRRAAARA